MIEHVDENGNLVQDMLITYSEEAQQQHKINKANAGLVFSPKFIPVYPELLDMLTPVEAMIFGFVDFYKSSSSERFYFTNDQIATMIKCSSDTVSRAISKLEKDGFIKTSRKVKAGGGQIRFINDISYKLDSTISTSQTRQKLQTNKNKINNNKINITKEKNIVKKEKFLDFVKLSDTEYQKLINEYGQEQTGLFIDKLNDYLGSTGKRYKSHYHTIRTWIRKDAAGGLSPNMAAYIATKAMEERKEQEAIDRRMKEIEQVTKPKLKY